MTGTRAVIAAVALLLGLSACSGEDPEPRVAPSSPSVPSTTAASVETPPEMPDAAKGSDAAAAEAFVKFYWELVDYAQQSGNVASLRSLGQNCVTCEAGIKSITEIYSAGGEIRGGEGAISDLQARFLADSSQRVLVIFTLTNSSQVVDYPGESRDIHYEAGDLAYQTILKHTSSGWRVLLVGEQ